MRLLGTDQARLSPSARTPILRGGHAARAREVLSRHPGAQIQRLNQISVKRLIALRKKDFLREALARTAVRRLFRRQ
jgi:hypothetical protein